MGRYPDDPLVQLAKGAPGRRRRRTEAAAERMAAKIVERQATSGPVIPDQFMSNPEAWATAIRIWVQQSSILRSSSRWQLAFMPALTRYAIWSQIYEESANLLVADCSGGDYSIWWEMGHGAKRRRPHPALEIMKDAQTILHGLDTEFGFTPRADFDLTRSGIFNARNAQHEFAFGDQPQSGTGPKPVPVDPVGIMTDGADAKTIN